MSQVRAGAAAGIGRACEVDEESNVLAVVMWKLLFTPTCAPAVPFDKWMVHMSYIGFMNIGAVNLNLLPVWTRC